MRISTWWLKALADWLPLWRSLEGFFVVTIPAPRVGPKAVRIAANKRTPSGSSSWASLVSEATQRELVEGARRRRYSLQRQAQIVMAGMRRKNRKGELKPYRVMSCLWAGQKAQVLGSGKGVKLTTQGATFYGLQICGSVWHCPVCAARITNHRRGDVAQAIDHAAAHCTPAAPLGYRVILMTLTARHRASTQVADQLEAMTNAYEALWRGNPAKKIRREHRILGMVRTLETTWAEVNGHHPHIHAIIFIPKQATDVADKVAFRALKAKLQTRWKATALRHGLTMSGHGFDLRDSTAEVAKYLAKWGHEKRWQASDEVTRWHTKTGKKDGQGALETPVRAANMHCTPWQLLEFSAAGDEGATRAFREYAQAFHGRQQLCWSKGLREALGMGQELTDQEAAEQEQEQAKEIARVVLTDAQWRVVRGNDARAELLDLVERSKGDSDRVKQWCLEAFGFAPEVMVLDAGG